MAVGLERARAAGHNVRIEVNRVDRVRDGDARVSGEEFLDVRHVAFGAVAHEYIFRVHLDAARRVFATHNGLTHKVIALFRAVSAECVLHGHLVDGLVHGLDDFGDKRRGYIADTQADNVGIFVCALVFLNLLGDGREKVAARQAIVVCV